MITTTAVGSFIPSISISPHQSLPSISKKFRSGSQISVFPRINSVSSCRGVKTRSLVCSMALEVAHPDDPKPVRATKPVLRVHDNEEELANALAEYVAQLSDQYTKDRGAFSFVLSGGSLVKSLRKLVEQPYVDSIEWSKWRVFWADERVVPKDSPDSNYKLAYDHFISKVPIPPGQVYAINDFLSAEEAADDYETGLKQLVKNGAVDSSTTTGLPRFDLMLLGMGPDGHVASLFPGHPLLKEDQRWVASIKDSPKPPPERITFTFPVINSSAYLALVVTGAGKAGPVRQALESENKSTSDVLPVQMVWPEDGQLTWFTDKDAASQLQDKAKM